MDMKKILLLAVSLLLLSGTGCRGARKPAETVRDGSTPEPTPEHTAVPVSDVPKGDEITMRLWIDDREVPVEWEENDSVEALRALLPLTIQMSMYGGFEQVGPIGQNLVRRDRQITTAYGDIVLYAGDQIVVFYGANSWAYTRLGHMSLSEAELRDLLSKGPVTLTIREG